MCAFYVGKPLTASFKARMPVDNIKGYTVERAGNTLFLTGPNSARIELIPLDSESYEVTGLFDKEKGENCKSVYRVEQMSDTIVIILYQYENIMDLTLDSKRLVIHLRQGDEDRMLTSEGLSGISVGSSDEIPNKLAELFVMNRSVFFQPGKRDGEYTMYGDGCWATILMEKPGVYVIDSFHAKKKNNAMFEIYQIFGHISFMLRSDALAEKGNDSASLPKFGYNEIFDVWDQYMSFQEEQLKKQRANHIYGYKKVFIFGSNVKVELRSRINLKPLRGIEFEYMPGCQFDYDPEKLPDSNALDILTKDRSKQTRVLGVIKNEESESDMLLFDLPRFGLLDLTGEGIIYLSDRSLYIEQRRRRKTLALIESGANRSLNNILRLSNTSIRDIEAAGTKNPDNAAVLKQMFGTKKIELTDNYRRAMSVALNTPDIALIQGPPGTGKTTLIKGLLARLKQDDIGVKVLLTSEQHDAMYNMIDRFTDTGIMPPYVSSKRYDEKESDYNSFEESVSKYQEICLKECEKILERSDAEERVSSLVKQFTVILVRIRECGYSDEVISDNLPEMESLISRIGCADKVKEDFVKLKQSVVKHRRTEEAENDPAKEILLRKIRSQRTDLKSFMEDDGIRNFESLQSTLSRQGHEDMLFPKDASEKLKSPDPDIVSSIFDQYKMYVEQLLNVYESVRESGFEDGDSKTYVENIRKIVSKYVDRNDYTLVGIVEKFQYLLEDEEIVSAVVRKYTTIVGSTCAQAGKLQAKDASADFDYVIVDEAARANPLDIMVPLALGKRVLLVGDHKQLPHYIETKDVKEFAKDGAGNELERTEALTKSLFQIIYENLEIAKKEGRVVAQRTAMIKEQHRMHPDICQFISDTFYDGELKSSEKTKSHLNTYGVCNGKNIGVINVPYDKGAEKRIDNTYCRPAEADKIIKLISEILTRDPLGKYTIGVIAYYRGQVEYIQKKLEETFGDEEDRIICGTVDSYQGKEFDIVILSGVRCNTRGDIGFIKSEPSRINVSLSRARNLMLMVCDVDTYMNSSGNGFETFAKYFDYCRRVGYYE